MFNETEVKKGIEEFNEEYGILDEAIYFLSKKNNHNEFYHVFATVKLINFIYRTQIQNVHLEAISKYIVELENNCEISRLIRETNPLAVKKIANTKAIIIQSNNEQNEKRDSSKKHLTRSYNNWSFATKYCAFHNPKYVIYDSMVRKVLEKSGVNKKKIYIEGDIDVAYEKYLCYLENINKLRKDNNIPQSIENKEFDKFLWLKGKSLS